MRKTKKPWKDSPLRGVLSSQFKNQLELAEFLGVSPQSVTNYWQHPERWLKHTRAFNQRGITPNMLHDLVELELKRR